MSKLLVGRYELIEKKGEGGMAVVYKAKDILLNRFVAVKILRPEFIEDEQFIESFHKESQAAAGLQSPNIVSVYDVGQEGNIHFIVMEYIDGKTLSDVIKESAPMNYKEVVRITRQIAEALSVAHRNNIIHRDIKPHNIMMMKDGTAKLGDFGIAKAVSDSTLTDTSKIIGSVHYFSPEQARGAYVDERSDIYSLGIIMFEMLTGKVPFDGDNPVQVALLHINNDIPAPSKYAMGIPPALDKLILKAADKFQNNRYESAEALLEDLNGIEYVSRIMGDSAFGNDNEDRNVDRNNRKNVAAVPLYKDDENDDDERRQIKKKKKKKRSGGKWKIILIIAIIAVAAAIIGVAVLNHGKVTVPDVKGMSYSEAEKTLEDQGLKIEKGEEIPNDTYEKGKVSSQDPIAHTKVKKGTTVTVNISSGEDKGEIPNLIGKYYDKSTAGYIEEYGFKLGEISYEKSDQYETNQIIKQNPKGGDTAKEGTEIDITVCSGKATEDSTVPSLTGGITLEEAEAKLKDAGLNLGSVEYKESSVYASGYVMWQQYEAGSKIKQGTSVNIQISKGAPGSGEGEEEGGSN